ncbi:MAG: PPOX class F420-dependent oxidoreductase [Candidatus Heimdallarchaeota archaeon]|nr:PPOX class F420-dependent oxidoreductase [Candidatus Heimdallarchaeota archaeon]MCK5047963.1 PPOX class F420-dependent oxidoreductase [Candidatus Heimdallarchaeota archaeon]
MSEYNYFHFLEEYKYISLTTYRRNGKAIATPVFFIENKGKLYLTTNQSSGKTKRLRIKNNNKVEIASCTLRGELLGESVEAVARIMSDGEGEEERKLFKQRYGIKERIFSFVWWIRHRIQRQKYILIEITPPSSS